MRTCETRESGGRKSPEMTVGLSNECRLFAMQWGTLDHSILQVHCISPLSQ